MLAWGMKMTELHGSTRLRQIAIRRNIGLRLGVFLVAALFCVGVQAQASGGEWVRSPSLGADDFVSNTITAVTRDKTGRLWVGTDRGLVWTDNYGRTWNLVNLAFAAPYVWPPKPASADAPKREPLTEAERVRRNAITSLALDRDGLWVGTLLGLCFFREDVGVWQLHSPAPRTMNMEVWSVTSSGRQVWVGSSLGLFRSSDGGVQWEQVNGQFPDRIDWITLSGHGPGRTIWLAGFDSPKRYGGGADLLFSTDDGRTWTSRATGSASPVAYPVSAHVNRLVELGRDFWACTRHGLSRSVNRGETWEPISRRSPVGELNVFDIAMVRNALWVATEEGLFTSIDNGRTWRPVKTLQCPVRELLVGPRFLWMGTRGGLLRRTFGGDWRTFSVRSNVNALAKTHEYGAETWWAGTTGGLAFSRDRGRTWRTFTVSDGLPGNLILSLAGRGERVWAGTDGGVWTGVAGGEIGRAYGPDDGLRGLKVRDIRLTDTAVYAATDKGLAVLPSATHEWRSYLTGKDWRCIALLRDTVFGALADPSARGLRMKLVRGTVHDENWTPMFLPGHDGAHIHHVLAVGEDIWVASDTGLFRSRDRGDTWARFSAESLWASRITRMTRGEDYHLCVQAFPTDPPSVNRTTLLNFTTDGGRSWRVLPDAVPGHANGILFSGSAIVVGTQDGVSIYDGYSDHLQSGRAGWYTWRRIAALAASTFRHDRLGWVSAVDRYAFHGPTLWFGSADSGLVERAVPVLDDLNPTWNLAGDRPISISGGSLLDGQSILAIADAPDGMWFGTTQGLFFYDRLDKLSSYSPMSADDRPLPVRAITIRGDETWIGTGEGLSVFNRKQMQWRSIRSTASLPVVERMWHDTPMLPDNRITVLACDGDLIWGGTEHGGFIVDASERWKVLLSEERISSIALGGERVYYGTDRGVFGLMARGPEVGVTKHHLTRKRSPLRDNKVYQVFADGRDVWAATAKGIRNILPDGAGMVPAVSVPESLRGPEGVLIVVNDMSDASRNVGENYRRLRMIPKQNVCHVNCPTTETISRDTYQRQIHDRVWRYLRENDLSQRISFVVTTKGMPLRIAALADSIQPHRRDGASLDSELAMMARRFPARGPLSNPYLHRQEKFDSTRFGMYLVTRLDGPTVTSAINLARRAINVEANRSFGARGFARFDLNPVDGELADRMNAAILLNYRLLRRQSRLQGRIGLPEKTTLPIYRPGAGYNTFFYLGWGAKEYRSDVFSWVQGAVGVCLDARTAPSLRDTETSWVAAAVDAGIGGTIGSVADPGPLDYLSVAELYRYLHEGYTWAEAAYMCISHLSWQMVVIGDPLYTPFK